MSTPYLSYIRDFQTLIARTLPTPSTSAPRPRHDVLPPRKHGQKCALILAPHPDDECLSGGLPLRLKQEQNWQIIVLPVTLGSLSERKEARLQELSAACSVLGFDIALPAPESFSRISPETRDQSEALWRRTVEKLAELLRHYTPDALFLPNIRDGHRTHIGTYYLGMDALALMPAEYSCLLAQAEYWQPNTLPNTMVGLSAEDAATLLEALCCHVGEVSRNPYHQSFPAYLIDNARRGSERVGGQGHAACPTFSFAMLYQIDRWQNARIKAEPEPHIIAPGDQIAW